MYTYSLQHVMHSEWLAPPPLALVSCTLYTPSICTIMLYVLYSNQPKQYCINLSTYTLQIILSEGILSRYGHSLTATSLAPGLTEVTLFGGCTKFDRQLTDDKRPMIADTAVLTLGEGRLNTRTYACA